MYIDEKTIQEDRGALTTTKLFNWFGDICDFNSRMGRFLPKRAGLPVVANDVYLYARLINEEVNRELRPAIDKLLSAHEKGLNIDPHIIAEIADGIYDSIVVLLGMAFALGIPMNLIWQEGHASNMAKLQPSPLFVNNKLQKPEGWKDADFLQVITLWNQKMRKEEENVRN